MKKSMNSWMSTEMGIDLLFYPEKIAAGEISDLLKRTATTELLEFARGKLQVAVFKLEEDSQLLGMTMAEFSAVAAAEGQAFRVVAITRKDTTIVPSFDTKFKYHDLVFIISTREGMNMLMRYIGKHAKCDGFEVNEWKWLFEMGCFTIALSRLVDTVDEV